MKGHTETANAYQEMNGLVKDLFVTYAMDEGEQHLYQMGADGSRTVLTKGDPQWVPMKEALPQQVRALPRKEAERLEDRWNAPFWKQIDRDLEDGEYGLFASEAGSRAIRLTDDSVVFVGEDRGPASQAAHGKDPYPFRCNMARRPGGTCWSSCAGSTAWTRTWASCCWRSSAAKTAPSASRPSAKKTAWSSALWRVKF